MEISQRDSPSLGNRELNVDHPQDRPFNSLIQTSYVPDLNMRQDHEIAHDETTTAIGTAPATMQSLPSQAEPELDTAAGQSIYDQAALSTDLDGIPFDGWFVDGFGLNFNTIDLSLDGDSYRNDFFGRHTLLQ